MQYSENLYTHRHALILTYKFFPPVDTKMAHLIRLINLPLTENNFEKELNTRQWQNQMKILLKTLLDKIITAVLEGL